MKNIKVHLHAKTSCLSPHTEQQYEFSQSRIVETQHEMPTVQQIELIFMEMVEDLDSAVSFATRSYEQRTGIWENYPGLKSEPER